MGTVDQLLLFFFWGRGGGETCTFSARRDWVLTLGNRVGLRSVDGLKWHLFHCSYFSYRLLFFFPTSHRKCLDAITTVHG